ncbi:hypothetical protein WG947_09265 [Pontibacter sp. H259]|uniref:hypothetical protein n=1 Tax=Pontibacter sp. H259 TaxID=3133421 RepID=UPI0030BCC138
MKLQHTLIACCLLALSACEKDEDVPTETIEGTLVWTGDYRTDGCGYILNTATGTHKPINESIIDDTYKANSQTEVIVKIINYNKPAQQPCRSSYSYNEIKIIQIQPK